MEFLRNMSNAANKTVRFFDRMSEMAEKGQPPRKPSEADYTSWDQAAEHRPRPRSTEASRRAIMLDNPVRWNRLQREFKWVQKRMVKMGLNPEEARWIL